MGDLPHLPHPTSVGDPPSIEPLANVGLADIGWLSARFHDAAADRPHTRFGCWPTRAALGDADLTLAASHGYTGGASGLVVRFGAVALVDVAYGMARVYVAGGTPALADELLDELRLSLPRVDRDDPGVIPLTFHCYSPHGPRAINRMLAAPSWEEIAGNYTRATADALERLFDPAFRPGAGGQLVVWHGPPGTGKTTALRALARAWRWCDGHYITDPDQFFGSHADYMVDILTGASDVLDVKPDEPEPTDVRWRLLILEDSGELLQPDARAETGQALSRFLNAVDGLIGQGLRVLTLVTTNENLGRLHPAVVRPGRCAAQVSFEVLSPSEAGAWLAAHDSDPAALGGREAMLADLYALIDARPAPREATVGFAP